MVFEDADLILVVFYQLHKKHTDSGYSSVRRKLVSLPAIFSLCCGHSLV